MPEPERSIRQILDDFHHKRVGDHAIWQGVVGHRRWLVPLFDLNRHYKIESCSKLHTYAGVAGPRKSLLLYSDTDAAQRAQEAGVNPGPLAGDFDGETLFGNLAPDWESVAINPGSDPNQWMLIRTTPGDLHRLASAWVKSVQIEQKIATSPSPADPQLLRSLRSHPEFMVLIDNTTNSFVTLRNAFPGIANGLLGFTAPDCLRKVIETLPGEPGNRFRTATMTGDALLTPFDECDGVIINPLGPGSFWAWPRAMMRDG